MIRSIIPGRDPIAMAAANMRRAEDRVSNPGESLKKEDQIRGIDSNIELKQALSNKRRAKLELVEAEVMNRCIGFISENLNSIIKRFTSQSSHSDSGELDVDAFQASLTQIVECCNQRHEGSFLFISSYKDQIIKIPDPGMPFDEESYYIGGHSIGYHPVFGKENIFLASSFKNIFEVYCKLHESPVNKNRKLGAAEYLPKLQEALNYLTGPNGVHKKVTTYLHTCQRNVSKFEAAEEQALRSMPPQLRPDAEEKMRGAEALTRAEDALKQAKSMRLQELRNAREILGDGH